MSGAAEQLRGLLSLAAAKGFAEVGDPELGPALREVVARLLRERDPDADLLALADGLERFDHLGNHDRAVIVARAQRMCMGWAAAAAPASKPRAPRKSAPAVGSGRTAAPATDDGPSAPGCEVLAGIGPSTAAKLAIARILSIGTCWRRGRSSLRR